MLNNDPGSTQEAELFGQGELPAIRVNCEGWDRGDGSSFSVGRSSGLGSEGGLERNGRAVVYLRPTCVGIVSPGVIKVTSFGAGIYRLASNIVAALGRRRATP